jgi:hypothetical protein
MSADPPSDPTNRLRLLEWRALRQNAPRSSRCPTAMCGSASALRSSLWFGSVIRRR